MFPYKKAIKKRIIQELLTKDLPKTNGIVLGLSGPDPEKAVESFKKQQIANSYILFETNKKVFSNIKKDKRMVKLEHVLEVKNRKCSHISKECKELIFQYIEQEESYGKNISEIMKELRMAQSTLRRWRQEQQQQQKFTIPRLEKNADPVKASINKRILTFNIDAVKHSKLIAEIFSKLGEEGIEWRN
jgi:transposase-like protein